MDQQWTDRHADAKGQRALLEEERPLCGIRRWQQPSLILRLENGDMRSFPYAEFEEGEFLGSMIRLHFLRGTVTIYGRHLAKLFEDVSQFHVWYVRERHASEFEVTEDEAYIERIEIKRADDSANALRMMGTRSM